MKILLSAYACEPNRGSEPGVGWHWAQEIARLGHDVWVLTCTVHKQMIEDELAKHPNASNLHFLFYDLPTWAQWWKKGPRGRRSHYFLWQWRAYQFAKQIHAHEKFEKVHHITYGGIRQPSFMGRLGIPFVFGPVGGGERAPWCLRRGFGLRGLLWDAMRDVSNWAIRLDPFMQETFQCAETIYVKTKESRDVIPKRFWDKVIVKGEIGVTSSYFRDERRNSGGKNGLRILYVGRLIYWKGVHLGLEAFALFSAIHPDSELTIVGAGAFEHHLRRLAKNLGICERVHWISWIEQTKLHAIYDRHDVLLFPSLHDSSGNVVLEAFSHGLPVVCLDLGGPGYMTDKTCGVVVPTRGATETDVVEGLSQALVELSRNQDLLFRLSMGARQKAKEYEWHSVIGRFYNAVDGK